MPEPDSNDTTSYLTRRSLLTIFVMLIALEIAAPSRAKAQISDRASVTRDTSRFVLQASDPRPMKAIVLSLDEELGWPVDYEDPPHLRSSPDVYDMTDLRWRATHPSDEFLGLKRGSFIFSLPSSDAGENQAPVGLLQRLVDEYNKDRLPGRFEALTGEQGRVAIVGTSVRTSDGSYEKVPVLLDMHVDMNSGKTSILNALTILAASLASGSHHQVEVGTVPVNLLTQAECEIKSDKMLTARVVLGRMLDSAPIRLSYYLLHDVNDNLDVINVTVDTRTVVKADGVDKQVINFH